MTRIRESVSETVVCPVCKGPWIERWATFVLPTDLEDGGHEVPVYGRCYSDDPVHAASGTPIAPPSTDA